VTIDTRNSYSHLCIVAEMMRNDSSSLLPILVEQLMATCSSLPLQILGVTGKPMFAGLELAGATFRGASWGAEGILRTTSTIAVGVVRPALSFVLPAGSSNGSMYELNEDSKFSYSKTKACKILKPSRSSRTRRNLSAGCKISSSEMSFGMHTGRTSSSVSALHTRQQEDDVMRPIALAIGLQAFQASLL